MSGQSGQRTGCHSLHAGTGLNLEVFPLTLDLVPYPEDLDSTGEV